jgi:hypothetical protein
MTRNNWTPIPDGKVSHLVTFHDQNEYLEGQKETMMTVCGTEISPQPPFNDGPTFICVPCWKKELYLNEFVQEEV